MSRTFPVNVFDKIVDHYRIHLLQMMDDLLLDISEHLTKYKGGNTSAFH